MGDTWWYESVIDDFCTIAGIMGFDVSESDVQFSGFWSQGDGASFTGGYAYAKGMTQRIRQHAPLDVELHAIADDLAEMQKRNFYQISASIVRLSSRYCHENTIACDCVERDSANYQEPTDDCEESITDCAQRLSQWLYSQLESECEYLESWFNGCIAREDARTMRNAGSDWINALRSVRRAWRVRHGAACVTACQIRDGIREAIREARNARTRYVEARDTWSTAISDYQLNRDAWRDAYSEGV
jgi:hypothetical protein